MKRLYKISAVFAALIVLLATVFAVPASAANVNYSVSGASGAKGDTVTVSVKLSSSVQIWGSNVTLGFNSSELQYISCEKGGLVSGGSLHQSGSSVNFSGMYNAKSGTVFTVKFKILKDSGFSSLSLSSTENIDGDGNAYSCAVTGGNVTVIKPVTGISLNKTSVTLKKGGTDQLAATVTPSDATNKAVTYSSSNKKVATVNGSGKITAVGGGTATITAKAGDKTATCKVTVDVAQTGISASGSTSRSVGIGSTLKLSVNKVPADATSNYSVSWSSANPEIASVSSNGTVTAVALGETTVTAKANTWTVTYKITVVEKTSETTSEPTSDDTSETEEPPTETTTLESAVPESSTENVTENKDNGTVSKAYHYGMVAGASALTAVVSVTATYFIVSRRKREITFNGNGME